MNIQDGQMGRGGAGYGEVPPDMPWDQKPSIYDHISAHIVTGEKGLSDGGEALPDEARKENDSQIRWAAGAMDGVMGHHMETGGHEELIEKVIGLVLTYCVNPTVKTKADLYQHILEGTTLPLIDPIIDRLVNNEQLGHDRLYDLAYSLVAESPDREPVKFGAAILGVYQIPENEHIFQTLGRHEEFTLYSAVALTNLSNDPDHSLWELAKNVEGWGRIQVVERLANTENSDIKDWLLREGFRNSIMYEYLAYTCATGGGLLTALGEPNIDRELLTSSGEIIAALISGGPAEGIDEYIDAPMVIELFLNHLEGSATKLIDFVHLESIRQFLNEDGWENRFEQGWSQDKQAGLSAACDRILSQPEWERRAVEGLNSSDDVDFYHANRVAEALGMETWDVHWERLRSKPLDSTCWFRVMERCNDQRIAIVLNFAEENLDLGRIATGPTTDLGLGPGFEPHLCLDFVLQRLGSYVGKGESLIKTGLKSSAIRGRNMAVSVLAEWTSANWSDTLRESLETAAQCEPDDSVRLRMEKALCGKPLAELDSE